jgi:hypothetical protein
MDYSAQKWEKRSIFGKIGEKSPSGKERQTFRPGSMLTSEGKKKR